MNDTFGAAWRPDRLLRALLFWTALTTVLFRLPTVRGLFDGPSYQGGVFGFGGRGTGGYRITLPASAIQIVGRS